MEETLQYQATTQCIGLSPSSPRNHLPDGPEASHAITINPDHSGGADQLGYFGREWFAMKLSFFCLIAGLIAVSSVAQAEVEYPLSRNTVAPGELYHFDQFGDWSVDCVRDPDGEDYCSVAQTISALDFGLELEFLIAPYTSALVRSDADVDIAPRAYIAISPYSTAEHYEDYSAQISSLEGEPFDAFWCPLTDAEDCNRGPELDISDLERLTRATSATISIYRRGEAGEVYSSLVDVSVDLSGLSYALESAISYNEALIGLEAEQLNLPIEMCTFVYEGRQRRISYVLDEDLEASLTSYLEMLRGPRDGGTCPSYVVLANLTPEMTNAQRQLFCLVMDDEGEQGVVGFGQGQGDSYRRCDTPTPTFCERVNSSRDAAVSIVGLVAGSVGTAVGTTSVTGTSVVLHSSGAAIVTGSGGYVAGTLGTIGTTMLGIATAPATLTAAVVSVVAVGGAVYVCSGEQ